MALAEKVTWGMNLDARDGATHVAAEVGDVTRQQVGRCGGDRGLQYGTILLRKLDPLGQGAVGRFGYEPNRAQQAIEPSLGGLLQIPQGFLEGVAGGDERHVFECPQLQQPALPTIGGGEEDVGIEE